MILDTSKHWTGQTARKTKVLYAKSFRQIFADHTVFDDFQLCTLEGNQSFTIDSMMCKGELGDTWQQTRYALDRKYDIVGVDVYGWIMYKPKPTSSVEFFAVTPEMLSWTDTNYIVGLHGDTIGEIENCQKVASGDFIARDPADHNDQWVVARKIWINSYEVNPT